jgi:cysteine-S-conjugate beta-lyase
MIYLESPGSRTMEMSDVPAIAAAGRRAGRAGGDRQHLGGKPVLRCLRRRLRYLGGGGDEIHRRPLRRDARLDHRHRGTREPFHKAHEELGQCAGPDDIYLGLRGLRSLDARLERHQRNALVVAEWLGGRAEVAEVLYPALPGTAGHELWKRDFTGASGLFSFLLKPCSQGAIAAFVDGLELFGLGASWGGFESLVLPFQPAAHRVAAHRWNPDTTGIRLHIGLENPDDLMDDLAAGFERMKGL